MPRGELAQIHSINCLITPSHKIPPHHTITGVVPGFAQGGGEGGKLFNGRGDDLNPPKIQWVARGDGEWNILIFCESTLKIWVAI